MTATTTTTYVRPYGHTALARYLDEKIDSLPMSQREIAQAVGWKNSNMVTMLKKGDARVPLDRAADLARVIGADPVFILRLAMLQYLPDQDKALLDSSASRNEQEILKLIREVSGNGDPGLNDARTAAIKAAFGK